MSPEQFSMVWTCAGIHATAAGTTSAVTARITTSRAADVEPSSSLACLARVARHRARRAESSAALAYGSIVGRRYDRGGRRAGTGSIRTRGDVCRGLVELHAPRHAAGSPSFN